MSNETKIGLMAVIVLAIFIWGYKFIQGKNLLSSNTTLYVEYDDVFELTKSSPIIKNGLQIGVVTDIAFKETDMNKVVVALDITEDIDIPKTAVASLYFQGVMGGRAVEIRFDKPCASGDCAVTGDFLASREKGLIGSLVDPKEIPAYMEQLSAGAKDLFNSLNETMSDPNAMNSGVGKMLNDFSKTLENLTVTTNELNKLLSGSAAPLKKTLENVASLTGNLKNSNEKITDVVDNMAAFTGQLKDADLKMTIEKTNGTMDSATKTIDELKVTLGKVNGTFDSLNDVIAGIKSGKGSIGKLMNDEALYKKLNEASREVSLLLEDIRLHPKRYTRILSKKEVPYEAPQGE